MPFVKDEWTRLVAKRLLITSHSLCECQIKTSCDGMQFCLLQKPPGCSDRSHSQPSGRPFPVHWHWRPLMPFSIYRNCLTNSYGSKGPLACRNQARPGVCVECMWSCSKDLHFFLSFLKLFFFCIHAKPFDKQRRIPRTHTHTSLSGNVNNSRGDHWGFSGFLKVWSHMAVGSLKRNMVSISQGWIPSS